MAKCMKSLSPAWVLPSLLGQLVLLLLLISVAPCVDAGILPWVLGTRLRWWHNSTCFTFSDPGLVFMEYQRGLIFFPSLIMLLWFLTVFAYFKFFLLACFKSTEENREHCAFRVQGLLEAQVPATDTCRPVSRNGCWPWHLLNIVSRH